MVHMIVNKEIHLLLMDLGDISESFANKKIEINNTIIRCNNMMIKYFVIVTNFQNQKYIT